MAFAETREDALLTIALIESISLNIDLIELIASRASPEMREALAFQHITHRVEALKDFRHYLESGEERGEATWQ